MPYSVYTKNCVLLKKKTYLKTFLGFVTFCTTVNLYNLKWYKSFFNTIWNQHKQYISFSWTLLFVFDPLPFSFPHTAEIGDYDDIADREFLKMNKLLPYQERVQEKIMELHRRHM